MEIVVLRLIHVLGGIFWVGSALFTTFFLLPALAQAGPAAGTIMAGLQQRRLMILLPLAALLTIASGLRLLWITSTGFTAAYFSTPSGRAYALSGLAAIVGFLLALAVARPAGVRAAQLAAPRSPAGGSPMSDDMVAEVAKLRRRAAVSGAVVTLLVTVAAAGMAVARYL
jgi:uncharacterized membrane protein